ncbi:hypothetical protein RRG08_002624 [Elysia crispata]|uniref:Uncharacterized protein n=1 Tax=Elysia crispata TaxID=231223 RepID=A0AAE0Y576_9GAST|nr:hypothetical protein RRG08_002624 [Elysia crispata]
MSITLIIPGKLSLQTLVEEDRAAVSSPATISIPGLSYSRGRQSQLSIATLSVIFIDVSTVLTEQLDRLAAMMVLFQQDVDIPTALD